MHKKINSPGFTIIIATFNVSNDLEYTLDSIILNKEYVIEIIVIDGGSTDGTVEIIKKYQNHITYWISEVDNGIYDAMNKGWNVANDNDYILFLGAGDSIISMPAKESFNKANIIVGNVQIGNKYLFQPKVDFRLKLGNTLHHQALLIKKSIHPDPPFNIEYDIYADFDFNQRLYKKGHNIYYDMHFKSFALEGGLSAKFDKNQSLKIVRKNYGLLFFFMAKLYLKLHHTI